MKNGRIRRYFAGLSRNTVLLAFASLFADISSEMLYPILPVFLTSVLHASGSVVGIVEGIAQATQNVVQGFSGWLSDRIQRRKPIALFGYALSAAAKPLIGFASVWQFVLGARFLDRLGSGTRSAPRDALIAASVAPRHRGKAFGLEGIGDNLGACLGPLLTVGLIAALALDMRAIFYLAFIPGVLAFVMTTLVKERKAHVASKQTIKVCLRDYPKAYWKYLAVIALFGTGNSSNAFLILQTQETGASLETTILIYAAFNLVAALISYPAGYLSDLMGRKYVLLASFVIFALTYLGFALSGDVAVLFALFAFYGLFQGIYRTAGKALAADFVPERLRASGIGWYSTTVGLLTLFASVVAGVLWDNAGHAAVFYYGAAFAALGALALLFAIPSRPQLTTGT